MIKILFNIFKILLVYFLPLFIIVLLSYWLYNYMSPIESFFKFTLFVLFIFILFIFRSFFINNKAIENEKMEITLANNFINRTLVKQLIEKIETSFNSVLDNNSNKNRNKSFLLQSSIRNFESDIDEFYNFCEISEVFEYKLGDLFRYLEIYNKNYAKNNNNNVELEINYFNDLSEEYILNGNLSIIFEIIIQSIEYLRNKPNNWKSNIIELEIIKRYGKVLINVVREKNSNNLYISDYIDEDYISKYKSAKLLANKFSYYLSSHKSKDLEYCSLMIYS